MNIQEYIQSGIIESYVLGLADADEVAEVEQLRATHPAIEEAIQTFEAELELASISNAVPVPSDIKQEIFNTLNLPISGEIPKVSETPIVPIATSHKTSFAKYVAAASVILFLISAGLNIYTYSKYKTVVAENKQLALQQTTLFAKNDAMQTKVLELDKNLQLITDPNVLKVTLRAVPGKEKNEAVVYWSRYNKEVYLVSKTLPAAPKGKQYQLWALMDGKPIDAGVVQNCISICKLKNIENAQAFAITLENEGGSPTPNLDQLYVMGEI